MHSVKTLFLLLLLIVSPLAVDAQCEDEDTFLKIVHKTLFPWKNYPRMTLLHLLPPSTMSKGPVRYKSTTLRTVSKAMKDIPKILCVIAKPISGFGNTFVSLSIHCLVSSTVKFDWMMIVKTLRITCVIDNLVAPNVKNT
jgi:hypothetical protein